MSTFGDEVFHLELLFHNCNFRAPRLVCDSYKNQI